jgi:hypothetical protein
MRSRPALAALAAALALGCVPSVEIDAPDIEITQPNLSFPAAPAGAGQSVTALFSFSIAKLGAASKPDGGSLKNIKRMQITQVVLKADSGIEDFSFLDRLTVDAANLGYATQSGPGQPVIRIVDYQAPDVASGAVLQLPLSPPVDMLPLWGHTSVYVTVTATGTLPTVAWSMDVVFSLSLDISQ